MKYSTSRAFGVLVASAGAACGLSMIPARAVDSYVLTGTGTTTSCVTGDGSQTPAVGTFDCPSPLNAARAFTFNLAFGLAPAYTIEPGGSMSLFADANPTQSTVLLGQGSPVSDYDGSVFSLGAISTSDEVGPPFDDPQLFTFDFPAASLPAFGESVNGSDADAFYSTCNSDACKTNGNQRISGLASINFTITRVPAPLSGLALVPLLSSLGILRKRYTTAVSSSDL
ncbi:hypothetical protein KBZ18_14315 [Synechococcus sp. Cruz-9H2]|uniref:hypothetical protein n=1 Tax=unclassified Synechococcus TaxID=2626047 RepID=UPI0020CDC199|nr:MULTISPECIES: hypothetical protein [unclassified Synechococcus]MCP9820658.1 hypothetical protein [Synechococcus sp. Cruz-9H2]MCP9844832.1 hypothetical protein [Synechococcus sp. Edmonson 11F2]MCP9856954.1 hypothetical protein [Synechococcus sp. Cruz-9C9]MCP9864240.1 hypothetical protein [Synechococcus sp. Cruz-7E5]MCP9871509.1 hypothetical protein [Synechococcus sp. Cruz-7B9]